MSVFAESSGVPGPADIIRDSAGGCIFFDANGDAFNDAAAEFQLVITNNKRGTYMITCHGQLPSTAVLPTDAMHWDGGNTGYACASLDDWKGTTSPSGEARFSCHGTF